MTQSEVDAVSEAYYAGIGRKKLTFEEAKYEVECNLRMTINGEPHTVTVTIPDIKNYDDMKAAMEAATHRFLVFSLSTTVPFGS